MPTRRAKPARRRAFTMVEIMIVVAIMGVLLVMALPGFQLAGRKSRASNCVQNLKAIMGAKERWALERNIEPTATPVMTELVGPELYLKSTPSCPDNGTYTIGDMNTIPTCTIGGTPGSPTGHALQ